MRRQRAQTLEPSNLFETVKDPFANGQMVTMRESISNIKKFCL